ncbi:hypothetical protein LOC54_03080 [Acetobacter sp. AN02]|uniref:hypothetical protein n=1 Tax=Acetobacter sp. AN02 TaxID=2894186 RepID=UPI0024342636|nr:hypothetical protein [Acetobacter sp. AN02]MDG6094106.1 hypothetical protein [Acetobacter sp. AN02]
MMQQTDLSATAPRSFSRRLRRRVARGVALCAMGSWVLLAIVPVVVVILELGR